MTIRRGHRAFESIESAHEFLNLLIETVRAESAATHFDVETLDGATARHEDALRLAQYKLRMLASHLTKSRLLLNDLRTLRRYLLDERAMDALAHRKTGRNQPQKCASPTEPVGRIDTLVARRRTCEPAIEAVEPAANLFG